MPLIGRGGQGRGRHGLGVGGLILATVALIALGTANASQLGLAPAHLSAATAGHPCSGTASMVPANWQSGTAYRSVVLALPAGCGGLPVQLNLREKKNGNTTDRSGTGTTDASGVVSIRMTGNYDRDHTYTARATVNGWDLPVAWNTTLMPSIWCTVIDASGATCTATVTLGVRGGNNFYHVVVTTPSTSWVKWEVTFNLAHPFYVTVPTRLGNADLDQYSDGAVDWAYDDNENVNDVQRSGPCTVPTGELRVTGLNNGYSPDVFRDVTINRTRVFDLLLNVTTPGGYDDVISPGC